jgi:FkbM family methyltransferase
MTLAQLLLRIRPVELAEILKRALGIDYREVKIGELTLWADPASNFGNRVISDGNYEPEFTASLLKLLRPGSCFVDLGANEGWFSLQASGAVGPEGMVFAIEPQRRLWPVIHQNFILNGRTNYRLIPYAVGQQEGFIDLILHPSLNTGSTTAVSNLRRTLFRRQKTGVLPLEAIMQRFSIPRIDVLKIDIEGFELNALRSLGPRLSDGSVAAILIEYHPAQLKELGQSKEEVVRLLRESGYGCSGADETVWTRGGGGN